MLEQGSTHVRKLGPEDLLHRFEIDRDQLISDLQEQVRSDSVE